MYRTTDTSFWTDPKILALPPNGKLFMLYLVTNPHSHVAGIYYLPMLFAEHETGLSKRVLNTLWHTLSSARLAWFDEAKSVVWVRRMFHYQGRGEKNERAAAAQLRNLHGSNLIARFLAEYPGVALRLGGYPIEGVSEFGTPDQEQDQDQDQEQKGIAARPEDGSAQPAPLLTFPCIGSPAEPKEWHLTPRYVAELSESYAGIDILAEARKALAWVRANRPKTAKGMPAFLVNWLNRAAEKPAAQRGPQRMPTASARRTAGYDPSDLRGDREAFDPDAA